MIKLAARRIAMTIPVLLLVALLVFSLLHLSPGDPAVVLAGDQATPEQIAQVRARMGLDQPFLIQFGRWGWNLLHGDLGRSLVSDVPVVELIGQRIGPTLSLTLLTLLWSVAVAVPLAVVAAWKHNSLLDRAVMLLGVAGFSVPLFAPPLPDVMRERQRRRGSIAWCCSLSHNGYDNNVSRISGNVLRRFLDPTPI